MPAHTGGVEDLHPHEKEQCKRRHNHHVGKISQNEQNFVKQMNGFLLVGGSVVRAMVRETRVRLLASRRRSEDRLVLRQHEDRREGARTYEATKEERRIEVSPNEIHALRLLSTGALSKGTTCTTKVDDGKDKIAKAHVAVVVVDEH